MVAFQYRMPSGIPGSVNRNEHSTIEAEMMDPTNPTPFYGMPMVRNTANSKVRPFLTGDLPSAIIGFLVRPFPTVGLALVNDPIGVSVPAVGGVGNVLKRGYLSVLMGGSTAAAKDGPVYVRGANPVTGKPIGGLEAAADQAATSAPKAGGNTGTGAVSAITTTALTKSGAYTITFTDPTHFNVFNPDGRELNPGTTGVAYTNPEIGFTVTAGGTAFVAGDGFTVSDVMSVFQVPTCKFMGPADAQGNTEIAYNI